MANKEQGGWRETLSNTTEKAGIVVAAVGVLFESAPVVALGVLGYLAGRWTKRSD